MKGFLAHVAILMTNYFLLANAERFVFVVPARQIRRSPTLPISTRPNARSTSPYLKYSTFATYGLTRASLPSNNQVPHRVGEYERPQNEIDKRLVSQYSKGVPRPPYTRGYLPYDKKGGLVPFVNQLSTGHNAYPFETARPRQPVVGPIYSSTPLSNAYYHRLMNSNDPYTTTAEKNLPTKSQQVLDRPIRPTFIGSQRLPADIESQPIGQNHFAPQAAASFNHPKIMAPIIVTPSSVENLKQQVTHTSDLAKESSNLVSRAPPASTIGQGKAPVILRDTVLLGDYEKKIDEFTKTWPKLSAFPGAFPEAFPEAFPDGSTFFSESSLNPSGLSRSSDGTSNFIGRQGYAVKEEIDEPPFDFKSNPIIGTPFPSYPTPKPPAFFRSFD